MVLKKTPMAPAIRLRTEDLPLTEASIESAKTASAKYSAEVNLMAKRASVGAAINRITSPIRPPTTLEKVAMPRARPASPRLAIGYPSSAVAAAGGAPGALIRIAVIEPPKVPAQ